MTAWKLFDGDTAPVSTAAFHEHRERAPHVDQPHHRPRLDKAAQFVMAVARYAEPPTVSDLGCGDGGLLSLLQGHSQANSLEACWGYDFQPSNVDGWAERGVKATQADVFGADRDTVQLGTITVVTEVLEHLTDPAAALAWIRQHSRFLIASSPWIETADNHDECHAWAFDPEGYYALMVAAGWHVLLHEQVGAFQVVLAEARP